MTDSWHSRRRVLQALGTGAVATVAGCSGSDSTGDGTDTRGGVDTTATTGESDTDAGDGEDPAPAETDATTHTAKLVASDGSADDHLGYTVAVDGDTALVGAPGATPEDQYTAGRAYVFERGADGWTQTTELAPEVGDPRSFGESVALDGDMALVGDPGDRDPRGDGVERSVYSIGSVYVFERGSDGWTQTTKLYAADGDENDAFGNAVALTATTALVGAANDEDPNGMAEDERYGGAGSAYVFEGDTGSWTQVAKLAPDDGGPGENFGANVALADGVALVGAPEDDVNATNSGSAYVFERTSGNWRQQAKLAPSGGDERDEFGVGLAVAPTMALVGAHYEDKPNGTMAGAVYVYERTGGEWNPQEKFAPPNGETTDEFGSRIALDGETALITAPGEDVSGTSLVGAAYLFQRRDGAWTQRDRLVAGDAQKQDDFGEAVALTDGRALLGAPDYDTRDAEGAGSAYVFDL
ncbi:PKD domain-containing protein [Halorientalis pallida]|uniref:PKD domain-containing protein n=1 Tax=Halorientalis pallida TaxID=2479928 RepID=UPI003C703513